MVPSTSFSEAVQRDLVLLAPSFFEMEQYMDLLRNRMFRQTLVCHEAVQPNYDVRAEQVMQFHIASPATPRSGTVDLQSDASEEFIGRSNVVISASMPVAKAAFVVLGEVWPQALPFSELFDRAQARLEPRQRSEDGQALARALLTAYASAGDSFVQLWLRPPACAVKAGERPVASPLARLQAERSAQVTNLRHELVALTPFDRHLIPLLDGSRDRPSLVDALMERFQQQAFQISEAGATLTDTARAREVLEEVLEQQLPKLAKSALLMH
jgi:methyltransferase-like protein